ncbi:MAG: type II secretion system protein [Methylophilaceae bacterium]|nr:type II secretion system protein [Methylophilaceae bacterium]
MKNRGFAYIALLLVIAGITLSLGKASEDIAQNAARERETQLLFIGKQFINAIGSYYRNSPQGNKQYPLALEDLITDNRFQKPARHLRKRYIDPMTDNSDWGLVKNEQQQVIGVYSLAQTPPIKTDFEPILKQSFGENPLLTYSDWKFIYLPQFDETNVATNQSPP